MGHTPKDISVEYLHDHLRDWIENLWMLNNKDRITDNASREAVNDEFRKKCFRDNNRGLTPAQSFSEQSFNGFFYGLVYTVGRVSEKATTAIAETKLVDAWRHSVFRNGFQQRYNMLEEVLSETLDKYGPKAAASAFPKSSVHTAEQFAAAIETMGYKAKALPPHVLTDVIRQSGQPDTKPANKPVAPSPKTP